MMKESDLRKEIILIRKWLNEAPSNYPPLDDQTPTKGHGLQHEDTARPGGDP